MMKPTKEGKILASTVIIFAAFGTCISCQKEFVNGVTLNLPSSEDDCVCMPCFSRVAARKIFDNLVDKLDFS